MAKPRCECGKKMKNLGNLNNTYYATNPPQWDEVWACKKCKKYRIERVRGTVECGDKRDELEGYTEIREQRDANFPHYLDYLERWSVNGSTFYV